MPGKKRTDKRRPPRRWKLLSRVCLALAIFFALAFVATSLYRWMAGDALEGSSRLDYGVHHGAVWVVYYEKQISWIAVHRGGEWDPEWPRLWPVVRRKGWTTVGLPLWIPSVLFGAGYVGLRVMGKRRAGAGACASCGYTVGIPDATTCPECGAKLA